MNGLHSDEIGINEFCKPKIEYSKDNTPAKNTITITRIMKSKTL